MDATLEMLLGRFGYTAIFIGAILEGETVLLLAAVFVQQGLLDFKGMLLASSLGAFVGDQLFFHLGRCKGRVVFRHFPGWQGKVLRAAHLLDRRREIVVPFYRFLYGMRAVIPFLLGAGRCRPPMFAALSGISAVVWAFLIGSGGYYFGETFAALFARCQALQQSASIGVVLTVLIAIVARWWWKGRPPPSD